MHMLANHVFGLSERILELNGNMNSLLGESTSSRRLIDIVSASQHEANGSLRELGDDFTTLRKEVGELKRSFEQSRQETQDGLKELKSMLSLLLGSQLKI